MESQVQRGDNSINRSVMSHSRTRDMEHNHQIEVTETLLSGVPHLPHIAVTLFTACVGTMGEAVSSVSIACGYGLDDRAIEV